MARILSKIVFPEPIAVGPILGYGAPLTDSRKIKTVFLTFRRLFGLTKGLSVAFSSVTHEIKRLLVFLVSLVSLA